MKINWKKTLLWTAIIGGGLLAVKAATNGSAAPAAPKMTSSQLEALLKSKNWIVKGWAAPKPGSSQAIKVNTDGSISIGSGYRGVLVDENTIVTRERNGKAEAEIIWKAA